MLKDINHFYVTQLLYYFFIIELRRSCVVFREGIASYDRKRRKDCFPPFFSAIAGCPGHQCIRRLPSIIQDEQTPEVQPCIKQHLRRHFLFLSSLITARQNLINPES